MQKKSGLPEWVKIIAVRSIKEAIESNAWVPVPVIGCQVASLFAYIEDLCRRTSTKIGFHYDGNTLRIAPKEKALFKH